MEKLVIISKKKTKYSKIIHRLETLRMDNIKFISEKNLTLELLKKFDILIFENLKKISLKNIHNLKIILININKFTTYNKFIDVFIDPYFSNKKKLNNPVKGNLRSIIQTFSDEGELKDLLNIISILKWDTGYWKKKIGYIGSKRLTENIIYRSSRFIKKNKIEMVQFLSNCHDAKSVMLAEKNKFGFKDIRITLEKNIKKINKKKIYKKNISFKRATLKDYKIIKPISKNSYLDSRYYFDNYFSIPRVKNFYVGWLKKGILGTFDSFCLLICLKKTPIGFCTIRIKNNNAIIGLFAISQKYQSKGYSKLFLSFIESEISKLKVNKISVVTQGRNYSALKAYQNSNYKISKTELWYHKWINK